MIPRYSRPEMVAIWSPEQRFRIWFEIEAHAADAMAELGIIPKDAARTIWDKARNVSFDIARIDAIEAETRHDVIAFLTHLAEIVGPEARFVHQGMTSSDVLDTCLNVQLVRAADLLITDVEKLLTALKKRAFEHKMTPTIGRSHGIHAEPTTFGLKLAGHYAEFVRNKERLAMARFEIATNAGTPFGPLDSVASGGELARFALAMKAALAGREDQRQPVMIFDEVDQGVGGAVAEAVGRRLERLSRGGQVLVVTHSPQVAARGHAHWKVMKADKDGLTTTTVVALDEDRRREEIARMLSGAEITDEARAAARALIG